MSKLEIDTDVLFKVFKETHFCYEDDEGKFRFTTNDDGQIWEFAGILYSAMMEKFGREYIIDILKGKE